MLTPSTRIAIAWRLVWNSLTKDDARHLFPDVQRLGGYHAVARVSVASLVGEAELRWINADVLEPYIDLAADYVTASLSYDVEMRRTILDLAVKLAAERKVTPVERPIQGNVVWNCS